MGELVRDLRYAVRSLLRQPGFTAITVGTVALAIGANTAIFSVVQGVLLKPLPYEDPGRLVVIWANLTNRDVPKFPVSPPDLRDMQEQGTLFEDMGGVITFTQSLTGGDTEPEIVDAAGTTANFFDVLGIEPVLGRGFEPADADPIPPNTDASAIPPAVVILSYEIWQRRYGGDREVIGRTIDINNNASVVVGVMPPGTRLHFGVGTLTQEIDLWTPLRIDVNAWPARRNVLWAVVARVQEGVTLQQAESEIAGISARLRADSNLRETAGWQLDVREMRSELTEEVRPVLLALFGAVAFVLLIACANVSNLFLVRASGREREFAVRASLGGSRGAVIRQLLLESGVLAAAGGALGLVLAVGGNRLLVALRPTNLPRMESIALDLPVLAFTAAASLVAALLFGLFPALKVSNPRLTDALKDRGRSSSLASQRRFRNGIVVAEVALSLVLMVGAGLMIRSFIELQRVDPGFDPNGVLTFNLALPGNRYSPVERTNFFDQFDAELESLPGVTAVAAASTVPLQNNLVALGRYGPLEALTDESLYGQAAFRVIRPGYFETMNTALVTGEWFAPEHFADSSAVALVDEVLAQKLTPNGSPVGQRMLIRFTTLEPVEVEIIGVVRHQRGPSLASDGTEGVYVTHLYAGTPGNMAYAVRTGGDPAGLLPSVRQVLRGMDPLLPLSDVRTMDERVAESMTETRFALVLIGVFGFLAMALAAIGIYGVLSHIVRQRVGEIGVRMALGAEPSSILRLVLRQAVTLTAVGVTIGLAASAWTTRLMQGLLVGVAPVDLTTYTLVALGFFVVAMTASLAPVRRATRVDPVVALRED
jgi:putative ABC transport system permease protein